MKDTFKQLKQNSTSVVRGFTVHQQLIEVRFIEEDGCFELMEDGERICQVKNLDLASTLFVSIVD